MAEDVLPAAFYFKVKTGAPGSDTDVSFQDVSGIVAEMDLETYNEGGENTFVHRLPKGVKHQNLVVSRGMAAASSPLVTWCKETLEGGLAKPIETRLLQVLLLDAEGNPLRSWSFQGAYPVKWQATEFNSQKNELAIEKIEFAFNGFVRDGSH
ncbi:phage tail protein [Oryzomicrobium sp.]|uniref:phage tail protein n=1 Tax=Oryzomicrobium sp. TaxID=1911578 RepID=UPI0025FE8168|nr:phage tail protein [Oryzomicrobium sp.]MCE1244197.1 phage tail protein [Oryzomicrobium sp.]